MDIAEMVFDPITHPLEWFARDGCDYNEGKRQAECAIFQAYSGIQSVAVRFPLVIGEDDYTKRLYFYAEHIAQSIPMSIDNMDARIGFVRSDEAGKFLAWLADSDFCGCINAGSYGTVSLREIVSYLEKRTGNRALLSDDGNDAPYNGVPSYSLNLQKAKDLGFRFSDLDSWLYDLLNQYAESART